MVSLDHRDAHILARFQLFRSPRGKQRDDENHIESKTSGADEKNERDYPHHPEVRDTATLRVEQYMSRDEEVKGYVVRPSSEERGTIGE